MGLPTPAADRIAVVTGASSGIGRAIATELALRGHAVALVARTAERLDAVAQSLRDLGVRAEPLVADLSVRADRAALAGRVAEVGAAPHILVNNAGFTTLGPIARAKVERELAMIEVDVAAVADLCTRFVPGMIERGRGAVLNVASTAAFQPLPGQAGYAASKAFVLSYTQALAAELRGTGVTATALAPGPVHTGFEGAAGMPRGATEKVLPDLLWVDVGAVARAGVDGLDRGRLVVIPGAVNRIGATLAQVAPRTVLLPIVRRGHPGLR